MSDLHVIDTDPDTPQWRWELSGTETGRRTVPRGIFDTGAIQSDSAGAALDWLVNHGPIWECLDTDEEFTITIRPIQ